VGSVNASLMHLPCPSCVLEQQGLTRLDLGRSPQYRGYDTKHDTTPPFVQRIAMPDLSSPERAGRRGHLGAVPFIFFMFWILSTEELPERESRLTNAFSKSHQNHRHMVKIYHAFYCITAQLR
jgi:hypothetical protein